VEHRNNRNNHENNQNSLTKRFRAYGDMEGGVRIARLRATMRDPIQRALLFLELGVVSIVCAPLIKATYNLEGDGCNSLVTYDIIQFLKAWFDTHTEGLTFPGLQPMFDTAIDALMLTTFLGRSPDRSLYVNNLRTKVYLMVQGAREYFNNTIIGTLAAEVALYKTCKLVNPIAMQHFASLPEFTAAVRSLNRFNDAAINAMSVEYSTYRALIITFAEEEHDLTTHEDKLTAIMGFWKTKWHDIPTIAKLARYCMTLTPSSAAAERVFSVLKQLFSLNQMKTTLQDYVETAVMMRYNKYN